MASALLPQGHKHLFLSRLGSNSLCPGFHLSKIIHRKADPCVTWLKGLVPLRDWKTWWLKHRSAHGETNITHRQNLSLCLEQRVNTLYAAVSSFLSKRRFWEKGDCLRPHVFTVKELENKRKNTESVEKNTAEGIPENSLLTCKMRQGSACSASLGKTEARYLLRGDLCHQTQWMWKKN